MKNKIIDVIMFVLLGAICFAFLQEYIDSFKIQLLTYSQRVAMGFGYLFCSYGCGYGLGNLANKIKKGELK